MLQGHAVQKLHDQERMAVLLSDLIDRADVGMVEGRSSLSFSLETSQGLGVSGDLVRQKLQGNKTMESRILGLVNHTHPATADFLKDAVVRDGLANHAQECYGGSEGKSMSSEVACSEVATAASRTPGCRNT